MINGLRRQRGGSVFYWPGPLASLKSQFQEITNMTTETDPNGLNQHETGAKLDAGKPDASLLLMFGKALEAVAEVGTHGAVKYTRGGWQDVVAGHERYTAALLRHLCKEHYEKVDSDSGLLHAAHAAWNALARLELELRKEPNDTSD